MPNWAATNYIIRGEEKELKEFCRLLNTMENHSNGSRRFWMGNLLIALGMTYDEVNTGPIHCRGSFDPDPDAMACLCGPDPDESHKFSVDDDGLLRFSTVSAWNRCSDLEKEIARHFPSFEFFWKSTDEFGNFHLVHDPENLGGWERFTLQADWETTDYDKDEFGKFRDDLRHVCDGFDIPEDADINLLTSGEFIERFCDWRESIPDDDPRSNIGFFIWEER